MLYFNFLLSTRGNFKQQIIEVHSGFMVSDEEWQTLEVPV